MWLFVYGTLMDPEKAMRIFGRLPKAKIAFLPGYELVFDKIGERGGNPNVREGGNGVWGIVYAVDERDLRKLDLLSPKYRRKMVEVIVDDRKVKAWVYTAKEEFRKDGLKPERSCVERILRGAKFHKLPKEYIERLESLLKICE